MTPKEKAFQLVNEFSLVGLQQREEGITCALIAVDEIIKIEKHHIHDLWVEYWHEVKEEIANL